MANKALILGGGGPLGALEVGALIAFEENDIHFNLIAGNSIGSIIAAVYTSKASKQERIETLEAFWKYAGINDTVYSIFPINFVAYNKNHQATNVFWDYWARQTMQAFPALTHPQTDLERLARDCFFFWGQTLAFMDLNPTSAGLSRISSLLDLFVDLDQVRASPEEVYINVLNLTKKKVENIHENDLQIDHILAGASLPFLFVPKKINGDTYAEAAYFDVLNFKAMLIDECKDGEAFDYIVPINILQKEFFMREGQNLWDTWILSMFFPLATIAEDDMRLFELEYNRDNRFTICRMDYQIDDARVPQLLDWSYSNQQYLRNAGYQAALDLIDRYPGLRS